MVLGNHRACTFSAKCTMASKSGSRLSLKVICTSQGRSSPTILWILPADIERRHVIDIVHIQFTLDIPESFLSIRLLHNGEVEMPHALRIASALDDCSVTY